MKTKIKSHADEVADFYDKEIPKVNSHHTCLALIILDSALKKEKLLSQVFLKECKCVEKKLIRHISNTLNFFFSRSDESDED